MIATDAPPGHTAQDPPPNQHRHEQPRTSPVDGPRTTAMTKPETLRLHAQLYRIRLALERNGIATLAEFREYDALRTLPYFMWHTRTRHLRAVTVLAECIERALHATPAKRSVSIPRGDIQGPAHSRPADATTDETTYQPARGDKR